MTAGSHEQLLRQALAGRAATIEPRPDPDRLRAAMVRTDRLRVVRTTGAAALLCTVAVLGVFAVRTGDSASPADVADLPGLDQGPPDAGLPLIMVSREGGVEIEEVARTNPGALHRFHFDPITGLRAFEARRHRPRSTPPRRSPPRPPPHRHPPPRPPPHRHPRRRPRPPRRSRSRPRPAMARVRRTRPTTNTRARRHRAPPSRSPRPGTPPRPRPPTAAGSGSCGWSSPTRRWVRCSR